MKKSELKPVQSELDNLTEIIVNNVKISKVKISVLKLENPNRFTAVAPIIINILQV